MRPWNQVILFLVLESVLSSRQNVSWPRQLRRLRQDLVLLQEQVTALSNSRQNEDKNEVQVVAEQGSEISATELEPSASLGVAVFEAKAQETKTTF